MSKLRVLDLFSGIGGFSLGLERTGGFETVAFCEISPQRRADLETAWPHVPIFHDVSALSGRDVSPIDVITAGFPCQDISTAGKKAGIHGKRTGLFSEIIRLAGELRPAVIILENSADLLTGERGGWASHVFGELASIRYDAEWHVIPASGLGAPHDRERVWIIAADPCGALGQRRFQLFLGRRGTRAEKDSAIVAHDYRVREFQQGWRFSDQRGRVVYSPESGWPETWVEKLAQFSGMDDGLPAGLASETAARFGNAVIPQIPELIGNAILEAAGLACGGLQP